MKTIIALTKNIFKTYELYFFFQPAVYISFTFITKKNYQKKVGSFFVIYFYQKAVNNSFFVFLFVSFVKSWSLFYSKENEVIVVQIRPTWKSSCWVSFETLISKRISYKIIFICGYIILSRSCVVGEYLYLFNTPIDIM